MQSSCWGQPHRAPWLQVDLTFQCESTLRPLGFVPATINIGNSAQLLYFYFAGFWLIDFSQTGACRRDVYFTHCLRCAADLLDQLVWKCPDKRSCLLSPSSTHHRSTSEVSLSTLVCYWSLIDAILSVGFGECASTVTHWENNQSEESS